MQNFIFKRSVIIFNMADKSFGLALIISLVLLLSFKDMLLISNKEIDSSSNQQHKQKEDAANLEQPLDYNEHEHHHEDDLNENKATKNFGYDDDSEHSKANLKSSEDGETFVKKIPSLKMKNYNIQTIRFSFCYSCGYRNAFEQYSQMIRNRYPELKIVGENYSPQAYKVYVAQFFSSFKMVLIGLILFGQNPFAYFNMGTPKIFTWALENKLYACLMTFFLSNAIETQLITTGAFEVYLNDIQIWSKLQSDRFPHEKELLQILDMNFNFESEKNSAFGSGASSSGQF